MAHIVDNEENLKLFRAAMNNISSLATHSKNYGKPSTAAPTRSEASITSSPTIAATTMDPYDHSAKPAALGSLETTQLTGDEKHNVLSDRDINQLKTPVPAIPPRSGQELEPTVHRGEPPNGYGQSEDENDKNTLSTGSDFAESTLLTSPQLTGIRAPPPTPETTASKGPDNGDVEEFVGTHISLYLASKTNVVGLGESMYAPQRSSPLTGNWARSKPVRDGTSFTRSGSTNHDLFQTSRRLRDLSFDRVSFTVAGGPALSPSSKTPENVTIKLGGKLVSGSNIKTPSRPNHPIGNTDEPYVPPHMKLQEKASDAANITVSQPKTPANNGANFESLLEEMEAGTKSFLEKWGRPGLSTTNVAESTPAESIEAATVSTSLPIDKTSPRIVYPQEELVALQSKATDGERNTSPRTCSDSGKQKATELQTTSEQQSAQVDSTCVPAAEVDNLPPHLRFVFSKLATAMTTSPATQGFDPSKSQSHPEADSVTDALTHNVPSRKDQSPRIPTTNSRVKNEPNLGSKRESPAFPPAVSSTQVEKATVGSVKIPEEHFFKAFPKPTERATAAARIRKAVISRLPPQCDALFIASIVYGGPVESILMKPNCIAEVLFVNAEDCLNYCSNHENGLDYGKDKNDYVLVDLHTDVDIVGSKLSEMIKNGATRCVRIIGEDLEWTPKELWELGESKCAKLEHIEEEPNGHGKIRTITFRFCKMEDAVTFKAMLVRNEDLEHCNIQFTPDPCASATGVCVGD